MIQSDTYRNVAYGAALIVALLTVLAMPAHAGGQGTPAAPPGVVFDVDALLAHSSGIPEHMADLPDKAEVVGRGNAVLSMSQHIAKSNTIESFGFATANWAPNETINLFLNGNGPFPITADVLGMTTAAFNIGSFTGPITIELKGLTSGRRTAGVLEVSATGPFVPGLAAVPHAVNTAAGGQLLLLGTEYPPSSTVTIYRNGVVVTTTTTNSTGRFTATLTPANNGNTAAIYSADTGAAGTAAGVSIEERSDAGTPPMGDQNVARAFVEPAIVLPAGAFLTVYGEGFKPGETANFGGDCGGPVFMNADGGGASIYSLSGGPGRFICTLTGATSGRVAYWVMGTDSNATTLRRMEAVPASVLPSLGVNVTVYLTGLTPNNSGTLSVDGVPVPGSHTTNGGGAAVFSAPKPKSGYVHRISWAGAGGIETQSATLLLNQNVLDVDRDGLTDRTVFRPSTGDWFSLSASGGTTTRWGASTDRDVMADYEGDGKDDVAVWRPSTGEWFVVYSLSGFADVINWGANGDIPLAGDLDGDGRADLTVFRPSTGIWYAKLSGGGTTSTTWGANGDQPLLADFDGDGKMDLTIWRPSTGVWYIKLSSSGSIVVVNWGAPGDVPVPADFDGDGNADLVVWRPGSGQWFISRWSGGTMTVPWGSSGDVPLVGDMDGDGRNDFIVFRQSTGTWYVLQSSSGSASVVAWGTSGDKPAGRLPNT